MCQFHSLIESESCNLRSIRMKYELDNLHYELTRKVVSKNLFYLEKKEI